ncbi:hypothetical protein FRC20_001137 [Serendipita sp. 405]|nr:hypothetical protein FRC16_011060 [Serendipita sp. 398]KAG8853871.1 hypothetical protein FRC20_001137 [Serendipita sp. 405]
MQAQGDNSSLEDLSKYRKPGYEYVEDEKALLDGLVTFYRKRLEIAEIYLRAIEALYSTTVAGLDASNSLYELLALPALDCLEKDITGHRHYVHSTQCDLDKVTFPMGPRSIAQSIQEDTDAAKRLYLEYADSCPRVLNLPPPRPGGWKFLREEEITHRMLASRLHTVQKGSRLHFKTSYPASCSHPRRFVKHLVMSNATHRSEFANTTTSSANAERLLVDKFSTADAIAVPNQKMDLEKDRREYRHAPVLNPVARKLEEGRSVILGCWLDPMRTDNITEDLIIACLERYRSLYRQSPSCNFNGISFWEYYWETINMIETGHDVRETLSSLSQWEEAGELIGLLVVNTLRSSPPLLNLTDQESIDILQKDYWNTAALVALMKDIHPNMKRILKACVATYFVMRGTSAIIRLLLCNGARWNKTWESRYGGAIKAIFRRWDCDAWCPLPDDVEWKVRWIRDEVVTLRRMKRFPAIPGYRGGFAYLEVDVTGDVLDTPENTIERLYIKEERSRSWLTNKLQKSRR